MKKHIKLIFSVIYLNYAKFSCLAFTNLFIIIWSLLGLCNKTNAQSIELYAGINTNNFRELQKESSDMRSFNSNGRLGFSGGIAIDSLMIDWWRIRLAVQYDYYGGDYEISRNSLARLFELNANVNKSIISLYFYPINFKILQKKLDLNFGCVISRLIKESFNVSEYGLFKPEGYEYHRYNQIKYLSSFEYFGLQGRVAYDIRLKSKFYITPQYVLHYGISKEFSGESENIRSTRHYFLVGIKRNF